MALGHTSLTMRNRYYWPVLFVIGVQGAFLYYTTTLAILNTNLLSKDA